jgi:hypothetical protein
VHDRALLHAAAAQDTAKVGRNHPCPCGSGKKYKKCCRDTGTLILSQNGRTEPAPAFAVGPQTRRL